jgi:membrane protease YdiL (CAAX protease family)
MNPPNVSPSQAQLDGVLASGPMGCRSRSASLNRAIRYLQAVAFVGVWMASGWIMHLDANSYLLIGVPLVVLFQLGVRKEPLVRLWVRDASAFRLNGLGLVLALALAAYPVRELVREYSTIPWSVRLWLVCAIGGAFGAAFSLSRFTRTTGKALLFCLGTAGVFGCFLMVESALLSKHTLSLSASGLLFCIRQFLGYFPVSFVLEEVAFRGAIDAHVYHPGENRPWWSATLVSALWGLWHLPIVRIPGRLPLGLTPVAAGIIVAVALPLALIPTGIFLSFGWRRSGNLAVPAVVHALIDAVRNTVMM